MIAALPPVDIGAIFSRSWSLLRNNPVVLAPILVPLLIFIIIAIVAAFIAVGVISHAGGIAAVFHPSRSTHVPAVNQPLPPFVIPAVFAFYAFAIAFQLAVLVALYGLAGAAWTTGTAVAADGWRAVRERFWPVVVTAIGLLGLAIAALLLALPTLLVSLLALPVFAIYAFPAAVAGERGGFAAIAESIRLVRANFVTSVLGILLLLAIYYAGSFVAFPFLLPMQISFMSNAADPRAPFVMPAGWQIGLAVVGYLISIVLGILSYGYGALVQTGLYLTLRARAEATAPLPPTAG